MTKEKVNEMLLAYKDLIPHEKLPFFKSALEKAGDDACDALAMCKIYKPTVVLLLSIFLGVIGIDRFYIGNVGLGVAKLLFGWLTFGIWPLLDIFFSYRKAKEINLINLIARL